MFHVKHSKIYWDTLTSILDTTKMDYGDYRCYAVYTEDGDNVISHGVFQDVRDAIMTANIVGGKILDAMRWYYDDAHRDKAPIETYTYTIYRRTDKWYKDTSTIEVGCLIWDHLYQYMGSDLLEVMGEDHVTWEAIGTVEIYW